MKPPADDIDLVWARHTAVPVNFHWQATPSIAHFYPAPEMPEDSTSILWVSVPSTRRLMEKPTPLAGVSEQFRIVTYPLRPGVSYKFGRMLGASQYPDYALQMPYVTMSIDARPRCLIMFRTVPPFNLLRFWKQDEFSSLPVLARTADIPEIWEFIGKRGVEVKPLRDHLADKPEALAVRDDLIAYRLRNNLV